MKKIIITLSLLLTFTTAQADCITPWGMPTIEGGTVTAYLLPQAPPGNWCQSETRLCVNGALTGSYQNMSCIEDQGCQSLFGYIPNGGTVTAYLNPTEQGGNKCQSEIRVCTAGLLSGSYNYISCVEVF